MSEPEFSTVTSPTARKDHQCDICLGKIRQGTSYVRYCGKWDGDFDAYSFHPRCYQVYNSLADKMGEYFPFDDTIMYLSEHCQYNRQRRRKQQEPHEKD